MSSHPHLPPSNQPKPNNDKKAIDIVVALLLDRGDALLVEEYSYSAALESTFAPRGVRLVPVPMDAEGIEPAALDAIMAQRAAGGLPLPRALYCIPSGQNPSGAVASAARLDALYAVARRWRLIVIEDDAYFYLRYPNGPDALPGLDLPREFLVVVFFFLEVDGFFSASSTLLLSARERKHTTLTPTHPQKKQ